LAVKSDRVHEKKIGGKKSHATVPVRQVFLFPEKQTVLKIFLVDFLKPS
jgi:hypothetical protein